jgi:iron complex outermembrane receptor protein
MWLSAKFSGFSLAVLLIPVLSFGQPCNISFKGHILDESTGVELPFASIYEMHTNTGTVADSRGYFTITNLCPGTHHFQFRHIGCEMKELTVYLKKDTTFIVVLNHHAELMNEVVVHGKKEGNTAQVSNTLHAEDILADGHKNLAEIIERIQGVSILKTGPGISKPVIHGLYGNRVTMLNNGIAQSGQQWGNDHAPEIDPFVANHIAVVKGASALVYSGNSLGGVVLVEPGSIPDDSVLNGDINYIFQSNGSGHTLNTHISRKNELAAWRITGTLRVSGDMKSAGYYLTNTGKQEENIALQLEKKISDRWHTNLYYSLYNTNTGILRGSHTGNTTDLEEALTRDEPFYTKSAASYTIASPRQKVQHHLLRLEARCLISEDRSILLKYGGQLDRRKEFDVRRGGRSDIPALSLWQNSQFAEVVYKRLFADRYTLKTGLQFTYTDNVNNPETGILPLIPDYRSYRVSTFMLWKKERNRLFYEFGARNDLKMIDAWLITNTYPREIEKENLFFADYSFMAGSAYRLTGFLKINLDMGYVVRAPEINELYSFGLHQGVSGIEIGNPEITSERSFKLILSIDWNIGNRLFIQALGYHQLIRDYIYLQPQAEAELTIRGAFPVFFYEQTDARIIGSDLLISYQPAENIKIVNKFDVLKGINVSEGLPLIYMPPNNWTGKITWHFKNYFRLSGNSLSVNAKYVFKQRNYMEGQDYLPPPDGYFLLGLVAATSVNTKRKKNIKLSLQAENILNQNYRDYMNRQRYFADDLGINVMLRLSYEF